MAPNAAVRKQIYEIKDEKIELHFHQGQIDTWDSEARFVFMLAGSQGGKTSFGPWWLNREIVRCGSGDYLAVAPTYDLFNLKMLPEMLNVFVRILGIGKYWPGIGIIELCDPTTRKFMASRSTDPMWGRIIMRSASAEGGLESATAKAAWLDEVGQDSFPLEAWEAVLRRLSLEQGRVLGTTTIYNTGWLKQQIYTPWLAGDRDYAVIQFASVNNPLFPRAEFLRAKRTMPAWKFAMFYLGQFSKPPGLIYSDYDEAIHKIPDFPIPPHWPRYVGVDFGAVNQATVWIAQHPVTKVCYLYRESLEGNKTSREHAEGWKRLATDENVVRWVGGAGSEKQVRADLNAAGIPIIEPLIGGVEPGIDRVIELFKTKMLFIFESCTGVRDELGRYSRDISKSGEILEEIRDKNKFHRLDALRYGVSTLESATGWENIGDAESGKSPDMWSFLKG